MSNIERSTLPITNSPLKNHAIIIDTDFATTYDCRWLKPYEILMYNIDILLAELRDKYWLDLNKTQ